MTLFVDPYRFVFRAREPVHFPAGKATNVIRGALGLELKRAVCRADCPGAGQCPERATCAYARIFEPRLASGPSGLADLPRPFVIRCACLDGVVVREGEEFTIDVHGFDASLPLGPPLSTAFAGLAESGLGARRGSVELVRVTRPDGIEGAMQVPVAAGSQHVERVRVCFETPTELKAKGSVAAEPAFDVLAARARDRISNLRRFYQDGPLELDFAASGERARLVRLVRFDVDRKSVERRSGRTGLTHDLRGFVGAAEYEGAVGEFLPLLRAAYWTGVGRQTVWGHGAIRVE